MLALLLFFAENPKVPQELYKYLQKRDPSYESSVVSSDAQGTTLRMTSQTWHGIRWQHMILLRHPAKPTTRGTGILYITGDGPREGDYRDISLVAEATGMPVAMLFNVPNQPLWEMREDDLIAHTFEQYLATSDASWPLLFPMTKSAIRAMDAVQKATKGTSNPIRRFVVTGASKRGWTTWFVGAARDKRVLGIAPMVFDNLNVGAQMPHQVATWGGYSEMIQDYTRRGLQAKLDTPKGRELARMIDPYSYLPNIRVPTLIVKGTNDAYWTADATSLYWNDLRQPHWLLSVPNVGHDLGGGVLAAQTIGSFARALAGEFRMPKVEGEIKLEGNSLRWRARRPLGGPRDAVLTEARLWVAAAESLDFRPSHYSRLQTLPFEEVAPGAEIGTTTPAPAGNLAAFIEYRFRANGRLFSLSTPTQIFKR
jgi:PhoPQ-activated pathogenicity-related protein